MRVCVKIASLVEEDYMKLSCNNNFTNALERDKHVMINFIINNSENQLNISDRTKLAIVSDEELINKAIDLGINIQQLNEYTKPRVRNDRDGPSCYYLGYRWIYIL